MEPIEQSQSIASSTKEKPQSVSQSEPLSPIPHHDHNDPHDSDPNHLDEELQNKLGLKDEDENGNKGSNFGFGSEQLGDGGASAERGKSQRSNDNNHHGDDGLNDGCHGDDRWNDDVHLKDEDETENKGSNFDDGSEQLGDGDASPEHGKSQRCNDDHHHGDDGLNVGNHGDDGCNDDVHGGDGWKDETDNKGSNFEVGSEQLGDGDASPEHGKSQRSNDDHPHGDDGCNDDVHGGDYGWNKLDLKDEDETENKGSNFEVGSEELGDGDASPEHGKSQRSIDNHPHGDDGWNDDNHGDDRCNDDVHGGDDGWNKLDLKDEDEIKNKGSNFEVGSQHLSDEDASPEHGKSQKSDDVNDHGVDGWNDDNHGDDGWNNDVHGGDGWKDDGWNDNGWNGDEGYEWNENVGGYVDEVGNNGERNSDRAHQQYPLRPEAEDCAFYLKTGACKFGSSCKFNHPVRRKNQVVKEKVGERDELEERSSQPECKYYSRSGGCKFGKACKFNHTRGKFSASPVTELNFLGLPIRSGEKECLYYMRNGSCKFGATCKFNHPDPTSIGGTSGYGNGDSISLQGVSKSSIPSQSSTRTLNETSSPYVPIVMSPTPGVSPRSSDWNGYQAHIYPPSTYVVNNPATETKAYMHHQKPMSVEEFPERPGEPECSYFLKTGDCKFKYNCKFHHPKHPKQPKHRDTSLPPCNLSDKGLPLRPDQIVCTHYSRYGICKFGPACRFDHPITMPGFDQQPSYSYTSAATVEVAGIGDSSDATI